QSLTSAGMRQLQVSGDEDVISLIPGRFLPYWGWQMPLGRGAIQVTGNFNYNTAPDRIKRAVALLVWDHVRMAGPDVREAVRWQTADATYDRSVSTPTGLPEVDQI